jgi:hypothetical protein
MGGILALTESSSRTRRARTRPASRRVSDASNCIRMHRLSLKIPLFPFPARNKPTACWLRGFIARPRLSAGAPNHAKAPQTTPKRATCKTNPTSHAPRPATRPHSPVAFRRHSPSRPHDKFNFLPYNPPLSPARAVRAGNLWYGRRPSVEAGDFIQNGPRTQKDREPQRVKHKP